MIFKKKKKLIMKRLVTRKTDEELETLQPKGMLNAFKANPLAYKVAVVLFLTQALFALILLVFAIGITASVYPCGVSVCFYIFVKKIFLRRRVFLLHLALSLDW
jgi:hypothetical protein